MKLNNKTDQALKEALRRQMDDRLPSNFTCQTMEKVRLEAVKKHRRRVLAVWSWLIGASLFIIALLGWCLSHYISRERIALLADALSASYQSISFYWYVGLLVLLLLAFDHWMRNKQKSKDQY